MNKPDTPHPGDSSPTPAAPESSAGGDGARNGQHNGAKAAENAGPGTPGNVEGALDGKEAANGDSAAPSAARTLAEQSTLSGPGG